MGSEGRTVTKRVVLTSWALAGAVLTGHGFDRGLAVMWVPGLVLVAAVLVIAIGSLEP